MKQNTSICGSLMVVWTLFYTIFDVNGIKKCVPLTFIAAGLATRTIHHEMYNFRDQLKMTFRNQFMLPRTPSKGGKMVPRYPFLSPGWFMLPDSTTYSLRHNFDEIKTSRHKAWATLTQKSSWNALKKACTRIIPSTWLKLELILHEKLTWHENMHHCDFIRFY